MSASEEKEPPVREETTTTLPKKFGSVPKPSKKKLYGIIILPLIVGVAIGYAISSACMQQQYESLVEKYDSLQDRYRKTIFDQTLVMSNGLDEHYERIRSYESHKFTNKGDPGWLLFYATQVLHDLGNFSYGQRYAEFKNTTGMLCGNLTTKIATKFLEYIDKSMNYLEWSTSNISQIQVIYEWIDYFLSYTNDANGFSRFPSETLTHRCGDCEDQAVALSFLLESYGYETALCLIHDKNLTKYGSSGLYHVFCAVIKSDFEYYGTLIQLNEYTEYGNTWIVLDPAFGHMFSGEPEWMDSYRVDDETVQIPATVWSSLLVDYKAVVDRAEEIGITLKY